MVPTSIKTGRHVVVPGFLLALILMSCSAYAEDIYKIVDDQGNISYSSEAPQTGQATAVIEAMPPPPEADVEDALQRQQKTEDDFEKLDQARAEQAEREAQQRANNTTTVVQTNTVIGTGRRHYSHGRYRRGAAVAPGAPVAPGYRPREHRPGPKTRSGP